ncbi:MAG: mannitol dehydrogenase family protein [Clostridia bacterium]|nr:mannitol dehydrogenase family protein [Clostridia bacterium]
MLILNEKGLADRQAWLEKGYRLPAFNRADMIAETAKAPAWVHFGAGNIFRAFQCAAMQKLLDAGKVKTGIIAVEGFDYEIVEKGYRSNDNYSLLVTLKSDGSVEKTVVGSIAESCMLDSGNAAEFDHLKAVFVNPSLQMATFTITEKGYVTRDAEGNLVPAVAADLAAGPEKPQSYLGKVASLLYARYRAGAFPMAMVSTDNCSHNGEKLFAAMRVFAEGWKDEGFLAYISDPARVSFPWTMIDKITPRPDATVEAMLRADGLQGLDPVVTSRHTYIAPFVNAEESEYLVLEDAFPNGRPPLEAAGFYFTDRDTVNNVERMKVTTCLNPLHTALAVYGCLLGYTRISEEMKDPDLVSLIRRIGYTEGLPVVVNPGILDPKAFIDTVVEVRLPNPFMPDTPQRIACDTSQKVPIRFGETIKSYLADPGRDVRSLKAIPLAIAGWLRYLLALDDRGEPFELSPDPLLPRLRDALAGVELGKPETAEGKLDALLADPVLFGTDLVGTGLDEIIKADFASLLAGPGAVRETLRKVLS